MVEGECREGCTAAPASSSLRERHGLGEDAVDETGRVDVRRARLNEAPEFRKYADKRSPMLSPFTAAAGLHCDVTSCSAETIMHHRYVDMHRYLSYPCY